MPKQAAFVDCVSVPCTSILTETVLALAKVGRGRAVEVICNTISEANYVKDWFEIAGYEVTGLDVDSSGTARVRITRNG